MTFNDNPLWYVSPHPVITNLPLFIFGHIVAYCLWGFVAWLLWTAYFGKKK